MDSQPTWQGIAKTAQIERQAKIPQSWLLPDGIVSLTTRDVSKVPELTGILSGHELEITACEDATELLEKLHTGEWCAEEVMVAFGKRAAISHQLVNCLTEICFDEAIAAAKKLDADFKATGNITGPLHGLPISIKDHVNVAGLRSTASICIMAHNVAKEDAVLVSALKSAGAIVFVKTTMPVTSMMLETTSNLWGRTSCGFNRSLTCGGSSGGEGALIGLRGSIMGLGTDIGGSIRVPCAFNGLYGIRPTSRRICYAGCVGTRKGQIAINAVIGPMAHSIRDIELMCKVATDAQPWYHDVNTIKMDWAPRPPINRKLVVGLMISDNVVHPHPPVIRALYAAADSLREAGHEVIDFEPYDHQRCWDIIHPLYYATAGKEPAALLAETGEPWPPAASKLSGDGKLKEKTVKELFNLHAARDEYKAEYLKHWNSTSSITKSGRSIDVLLCPVAPSASFPHDFLPWWGYTSQFNLLDYPCVTIPAGFADKEKDKKDCDYEPTNEKDKENYDLYDPELFHNAPIGLQVVGRAFEDEKLLAIAYIIDKAIKN